MKARFPAKNHTHSDAVDKNTLKFLYFCLDNGEYLRLWKGNNNDGLRVRIGTINSAVEQAIAITDFTSRNKISLHSADHDFYTEFSQNNDKKTQLQDCLGEALFSLNAHWCWFSLNEDVGSYTFPHYCPPQERLPQNAQISLKTRLKVAVNILLNRYPLDKFL